MKVHTSPAWISRSMGVWRRSEYAPIAGCGTGSQPQPSPPQVQPEPSQPPIQPESETISPKVLLNASCGSSKGFAVSVTANGYSPNIPVYWYLMDSEGFVIHTAKFIPKASWFLTDSNGGFSDTIQVQDLGWDLWGGNYTIYFGADTDQNSEFDVDSPTRSAPIKIPC
jgi:hypothetical protein